MPRSYLPSLLGREDDLFGSLFREVQKTFEDFSRRSPSSPQRSLKRYTLGKRLQNQLLTTRYY